MKYVVGFILLSLITLSNRAFGQASSCTQTLRLVQSTYEQGRLHELETLMGVLRVDLMISKRYKPTAISHLPTSTWRSLKKPMQLCWIY
jgi:hypothetical protein